MHVRVVMLSRRYAVQLQPLQTLTNPTDLLDAQLWDIKIKSVHGAIAIQSRVRPASGTPLCLSVQADAEEGKIPMVRYLDVLWLLLLLLGCSVPCPCSFCDNYNSPPTRSKLATAKRQRLVGPKLSLRKTRRRRPPRLWTRTTKSTRSTSRSA